MCARAANKTLPFYTFSQITVAETMAFSPRLARLILDEGFASRFSTTVWCILTYWRSNLCLSNLSTLSAWLVTADCEAKRISADFSELWVSAECTSSFGAYCPPLEDRSPPTIACPDLSDLDISVDFVARLRRDNLVDAFLEVRSLACS